ncbi:type IX secretion system PorP/SprF family membrane protein [Pedobacter africanus]|uniref:Type IX secretion system PorP/SprF family membrane protein n=1 Tax=Pedobacter africanus TaxID=151894 RepID=A0ACC6L5I0_9SPHI|nr:type IX secretion system membrane protein PorP/SprF [Pedobacter africanus]MDR6786653.1 type IX secretion system PorP/SprF family membrane protein [Pedobacter africanus]
MNKHIIKKVMLGLGLAVAGLIPAKAQQNIQFSQYIFNSLSVNPAYAGYKEEWFAQLALRSQWTGLSGAPRTGQLSIDGVADANKNVGLGLQITDDRLGPQSATSIYANYAYRLRLNDEDTQRLSFGVGAGITQYGLDGNKLSPVDFDDPDLPVGKISSTIPDVRFGVYYYNPGFYIGVSAMDLLSGDKSNSIFNWDKNNVENLKRKRHYYLIAGTILNLSEDTKLRPSLLYKEDLKGPSSLDVSGMLIFAEKFWIGGSYRTGANLWKKDYTKGQQLSSLNSISAIAQFYLTDTFRIGYSYDHILSKLSSIQNGTHEITIGVTFPGKGKRLLSPRFF